MPPGHSADPGPLHIGHHGPHLGYALRVRSLDKSVDVVLGRLLLRPIGAADADRPRAARGAELLAVGEEELGLVVGAAVVPRLGLLSLSPVIVHP